MSGDGEVDTSRTVVQTYVPAYQRDLWDDHADRLDMSRSEFVKTMVQAGRREIGDDPDLLPDDDLAAESTEGEGKSLSAEITSLLDDEDALSWDELLAALTDDIEARLDDTLQELQDRNQVRYSGREDGYVLVDES
ncbi:hypothetical protein GRX03_06180 [Halovenus sp. WSH3]|uniref:Uncharacterized protein n=1 Tax=Halovenus carboxidivorans TaxID=2692199 RepID=A0A6B0T7M2_9EURY|nr:DUF5805 domain-containing protein [Halovenus carboxidivorans]MXR51191.1 hypothetical protein [Halovenus carboxidivorans]